MSLETFVPTPKPVKIATRVVQVTDAKLGQMPALSRAVKPIYGLMFVADFMSILGEHAEDAMATIIAATDVTEAEAKALDQAQAVELLSAIFEVNAGFFIHHTRPAMTRAVQAAQDRIKMLAPAGPPSSPASPAADTASPSA